MRSVKVKLISLIAMICLVAGIMLVGIFAAQTQQIKLNGQVNFEIADKSLYVKDVRLQADMNSEPESISTFMPGYVNGEFNMNLGDFTNTYGSFALYFDIINIVDETSGETFAYTASSSTTQGGVTVTTTILDNNGSSISQIPQGTVKPSEITSSTPISATIKITVGGTQGVSVDLSQITITINQYVQVYDYFDFELNSDGTTVTLTEFNESLADTADTTDIVIPATVSQNASGQWTEGNTYTVTAIVNGSEDNSVFYNSGITSIELPSSLETIGDYAFYVCGLTEVDLSKCTSLTSIGMRAFSDCYVLTSITLPSSLTSIGDYAFSDCQSLAEVDLSKYSSLECIGEMAFNHCSGLTGALDLSNCTSLTSIGNFAFSSCSGLTSITLPSSLASIGSYAFTDCDGLTNIDLSNCTSLTSIGSYAFAYCDNLSSIKFPNTTGWYATTSSNATTGTPMDMSNPEQNAEWLTAFSGEDYYGYYFKRNV